MLAYIFWHFPQADAGVDGYERSLRDFHAALGESGAEGFLGSACFRIEGAPWINQGRAAYADWYLVGGSFALDPLNEVAVSGKRQAGHDEAAAQAAGGAGGLYRLMEGESDLEGPARETWITKPRGISYERFYSWARPQAAGGGSLWRRQMVLGPAPEFCLVSTRAPQVQPEFTAVSVSRTPLPA